MYPNGYVPFQSGFRLIDGSALNRSFALLGNSLQWPGDIAYIDPANGSDGNGGSVNAPLASLDKFLAGAVAGNNDIAVLIGDGSTAATARESATLAWSKNATHLIGLCAPSMDAQRARISTATGATTNLAPLMTLSANGCFFQNFSFFQGVGQTSTAECLLDISGSRNYFYNVAFGGMGSANGAGQSGSYCIKFLSGGGENLFEHCSIGLETEPRSTTNTSIWLAASAQRNQFRDCEFEAYATSTGMLYVKVDAGALNGSTLKFTRCAFRNLKSATSGAQPAVTASVSSTANGDVYFDQCSTVAAKWAAAATNVHVTGPAANGFSGGVFANAADS